MMQIHDHSGALGNALTESNKILHTFPLSIYNIISQKFPFN